MDKYIKGLKAFLFLFLCFLALPVSSNYSYATDEISPARQFKHCALSRLEMVPIEKRPVYSVKDYGATGDGVTDDTQALQEAFDDTPSGVVLEFPPGVYLHNKSLTLSKDGTILMGKGGILKATNPDDQTIILTGRKSAVINMILHGSSEKRSTLPRTTKLWVKGRWNQILNNEIKGGASAGIFVYGANDFRIAGNTVYDTLADGIHMTHGSRRGLVEYNTVHNTEDDPIAVVSYRGDGGVSGDIIVRNNTISDISHGRGITVVGGENVLVEDNDISDIASAAGILIAQEKAYKTDSINNIIVRNNHIKNIQMLSEWRHTHHGAIDMNSSGEKPVGNIQILNNIIENSRFSGVRVLGDICNVDIAGNEMSGLLDENKIYVLKAPCAPEKIVCRGNRVEGKLFSANPKYCSTSPEALDAFPEYNFQAIEDNGWGGCE